MKKFLLVLVVAFGAWHWYSQRPTGFSGQSHNQVIMYSLTTCGYCAQRRKDLVQAGIPFVEHFLDRDANRRDEFERKLTTAGIPPQTIGTPSFDIYGHMLINNPSMEKIRDAMSRHRPKP